MFRVEIGKFEDYKNIVCAWSKGAGHTIPRLVVTSTKTMNVPTATYSSCAKQYRVPRYPLNFSIDSTKKQIPDS
ncbi:hypothetical protein HZ326_7495 [Fusarium oxysporum f. sp. albedinis]|nr:hypothetical protein HZ326_7495 [Fusarium oxysporum f. sp. albedinis]